MKKEISQGLKNSKIASIITLLLGIALLVYMIKVEDEPGAIPLFLILAGTLWLIITQLKIRKVS
ncbi:MAG: hypothetical protein EOP00_08180 [Pedobacter sp.]|nr:MAG: hypothetical protein EOP00_08180 [Pedobacter sp.]